MLTGELTEAVVQAGPDFERWIKTGGMGLGGGGSSSSGGNGEGALPSLETLNAAEAVAAVVVNLTGGGGGSHEDGDAFALQTAGEHFLAACGNDSCTGEAWLAAAAATTIAAAAVAEAGFEVHVAAPAF